MLQNRMRELPTEVVLKVLEHLATLELLRYLSSSKAAAYDALWEGLSAQRCISRPRLMRTSEKTLLLNGLRHQHEMRLQVLYTLRTTIWGSDADHRLRSAFDADPNLDPSTPLLAYGNAALLHMAARRGRLRCVRQLVERGANIDSVDEGNFTPLASAAWSGCRSVVLYLVEHRAQLDVAGVPRALTEPNPVTPTDA